MACRERRICVVSRLAVDNVFPSDEIKNEFLCWRVTKSLGCKSGNLKNDQKNCTIKVREFTERRCEQNWILYGANPHSLSGCEIKNVVKYDRLMIRINGFDKRNPGCISVTCGGLLHQGLTIKTHHRKCNFKCETVITKEMSDNQLLFIKLNEFHRNMIDDATRRKQFQLIHCVDAQRDSSKHNLLIWHCFMFICYSCVFGYKANFIEMDKEMDQEIDKKFKDQGGLELFGKPYVLFDNEDEYNKIFGDCSGITNLITNKNTNSNSYANKIIKHNRTIMEKIKEQSVNKIYNPPTQTAEKSETKLTTNEERKDSEKTQSKEVHIYSQKIIEIKTRLQDKSDKLKLNKIKKQYRIIVQSAIKLYETGIFDRFGVGNATQLQTDEKKNKNDSDDDNNIETNSNSQHDTTSTRNKTKRRDDKLKNYKTANHDQHRKNDDSESSVRERSECSEYGGSDSESDGTDSDSDDSNDSDGLSERDTDYSDGENNYTDYNNYSNYNISYSDQKTQTRKNTTNNTNRARGVAGSDNKNYGKNNTKYGRAKRMKSNGKEIDNNDNSDVELSDSDVNDDNDNDGDNEDDSDTSSSNKERIDDDDDLNAPGFNIDIKTNFMKQFIDKHTNTHCGCRVRRNSKCNKTIQATIVTLCDSGSNWQNEICCDICGDNLNENELIFNCNWKFNYNDHTICPWCVKNKYKKCDNNVIGRKEFYNRLYGSSVKY